MEHCKRSCFAGVGLIVLVTIMLCNSCHAGIFSSSGDKKEDSKKQQTKGGSKQQAIDLKKQNIQDACSSVQKSENELKGYADAIVLEKGALSTIIRWSSDWDVIENCIKQIIEKMPKKGSESLSGTNRRNIEKAIGTLRQFGHDIVAERVETLNVGDIKKLRDALAIKNRSTKLGGDAADTKKIKILLRNALLQLRRIVQYEKARQAKQQKEPKRIESWLDGNLEKVTDFD